jgi:lipoprotein NlpI
MRVKILTVALAGFCAMSLPAHAEVNEIGMRACINPNASAAFRLAACDKLLAGQDLAPKERALVLSARAVVYMMSQQSDKALADLDAAIKLWPDNVGFQRARRQVLDRQKAPANQKNTEWETPLSKKG